VQLLVKYWKAKIGSVLLALVATFGGWVALAWPEPDAVTVTPAVDDVEVVGALQYLAAVAAARQAAAAPLPEVRRVIVVTRPVTPEEIVVVVGPEGQAQAPLGAPPASPAEPAQAPAAPAQPRPAPAAPRPQPNTPRQPAPPPPQAPAPSAPPAPAPEPKKPPAPAPTASKGS
jgi:hypothetical protein